MTSTWKGTGRGFEICEKFLNSIVLLKINLLFIFDDGEGTGLKNWSFFVDVLNG